MNFKVKAQTSIRIQAMTDCQCLLLFITITIGFFLDKILSFRSVVSECCVVRKFRGTVVRFVVYFFSFPLALSVYCSVYCFRIDSGSPNFR